MGTREFKALELAARANIEHRKTYWYVPSSTAVGGHRVHHRYLRVGPGPMWEYAESVKEEPPPTRS